MVSRARLESCLESHLQIWRAPMSGRHRPSYMAVSLILGVWLPLQTCKDKETFRSRHEYASLAGLHMSGQLAIALGNMLQADLPEEQLAVRWCVIPGVVITAAFCTHVLPVEPLRLHSEHIVLSHGPLRIFASSMCSVTEDVAKASVAKVMSPLKAMLMGLPACMLWSVVVLLVVFSTTQSGYEWKMYAVSRGCKSHHHHHHQHCSSQR